MNEYLHSVPYLVLEDEVRHNDGSPEILLNVAAALGECRICGIPTEPVLGRLCLEDAQKAAVLFCTKLALHVAKLPKKKERWYELNFGRGEEAKALLESLVDGHFQIVGTIRAINEVYADQSLAEAYGYYLLKLAGFKNLFSSLSYGSATIDRWISDIKDEDLKKSDFFLNGTLRVRAKRLRKCSDLWSLESEIRSAKRSKKK